MTESKAPKVIGRRRRVPRREVDFNVGLLVSGEYYITRAHEIGEGGMLVEFDMDLPVGKQVVLSYTLADLFQEVVRAEVKYVYKAKEAGEPQKYGLQFKTIDFEIKRKIRNFVAATSSSGHAKAN